jgi:hypothetical protein
VEKMLSHDNCSRLLHARLERKIIMKKSVEEKCLLSDPLMSEGFV